MAIKQKIPQSSKGWRTTILRLVLVVFAISLVMSTLEIQVQLRESRELLEKTKAQVELQQVENKELERRLLDGMDEEKLDRSARDNLDYIGPNERVFIDVPPS